VLAVVLVRMIRVVEVMIMSREHVVTCHSFGKDIFGEASKW
jgi:hypothetical protein